MKLPQPVFIMALPEPALAAMASPELADSQYSHLIIENYLKSGVYPDVADKIQVRIEKEIKVFLLEGGHVHYIGGKEKTKPKLLVQSEQERQT